MPMVLVKPDFDSPDFSRMNLYLSALFLNDSPYISVYNIYTYCYIMATWLFCKEVFWDKNLNTKRPKSDEFDSICCPS